MAVISFCSIVLALEVQVKYNLRNICNYEFCNKRPKSLNQNEKQHSLSSTFRLPKKLRINQNKSLWIETKYLTAFYKSMFNP